MGLAVVRRRLSDDPTVAVPRRLVPFLDFARLPDRSLAAFRRALDEDDALRLATRDATDEASVGRASWLFLERPAGWEVELDVLAGAAEEAAADSRDQREEADTRRRLQAEEEARRRVEGEVSGLVRELNKVKQSLAIERRARRRAESDAGRLRRRTADLVAEADELRREESELRRALDEARAGADLGRARPAEMAQGHAQHAPALPLRSREQRRIPPSTGPPRRPVPLPPGIFDDSVAAAEYLVRVGDVLVLADAYNVTKLARPDLSLSEQRAWLVDAAVELAARTGAHLELIFDGADGWASAPADLGRRMGVQVRFSPEGTEADDVVLDLVANTAPARPVVVASDDRRVQDGAGRLGANVITSPQLLAVLRRPM